MGLVRSFIGTDGIWQYIPHINTGLFSIIKVHFLLFANLIVDWHINTINFTDSGVHKGPPLFRCLGAAFGTEPGPHGILRTTLAAKFLAS